MCTGNLFDKQKEDTHQERGTTQRRSSKRKTPVLRVSYAYYEIFLLALMAASSSKEKKKIKTKCENMHNFTSSRFLLLFISFLSLPSTSFSRRRCLAVERAACKCMLLH